MSAQRDKTSRVERRNPQRAALAGADADVRAPSSNRTSPREP